MKHAAIITDLFFKGRIEETARQAGKHVEFHSNMFSVKNADMIFLDLNKFGASGIYMLREKNPEARIIGYLSHLDIDLKTDAQKAGCTVLSRSEFTKKLPQLLGLGA